MKYLPRELKKDGFTYTQLLRGGRSCIYEQQVSSKTRRYEVFLIKVRPARKVFANFSPEHEKFPGNEDFGKWAWSCFTYEQALKRFNGLEDHSSILSIKNL